MAKYKGVPVLVDFEYWDYIEQHYWKSGIEDALKALSMDEVPGEPECPYTHAHTRHWCGYDTCRDA